MNNNRISILVIDDEVEIATTLKNHLELFGYNVTVTHNGIEALKAVKLQKFNFIFCDISMPNGGGIEFLEELKKSIPSHPPVFMMTAFLEYSEKELLKKGASGTLNKPLNFEKILDIIKGNN